MEWWWKKLQTEQLVSAGLKPKDKPGKHEMALHKIISTWICSYPDYDLLNANNFCSMTTSLNT